MYSWSKLMMTVHNYYVCILVNKVRSSNFRVRASFRAEMFNILPCYVVALAIFEISSLLYPSPLHFCAHEWLFA